MFDPKYSKTIGIAERYNINFLPVKPKRKKALSKWKDLQDRMISEKEKIKYFGNGSNNNIAFMCGPISNNLYVVDVDDLGFSEKIINCLPPTLTVKTKNGVHLYFFSKQTVKSHRIEFTNTKNETIGIDIQSEKRYVVAPPSIHPSGKKYEYFKNNEIINQEFQVISEIINKTALKYELKPKTKIKEKSEKSEKNKIPDQFKNDKEWLELFYILPNLENMIGFEGNGPHPIHGSETGQNLSVSNENGFYCFRHNVGGYKLEWFAIQDRIVECEDINNLTSDNWKEIATSIREKYNLPEFKPKNSNLNNFRKNSNKNSNQYLNENQISKLKEKFLSIKDFSSFVWKEKEEKETKIKTKFISNVIYLHEKLGVIFITLESIYKTEYGLFIYFEHYYQSITKKNNPIYHLIHFYCGEESLIDNQAKEMKVPASSLPQIKVCKESFKKEVLLSIKDRLPLIEHRFLFNAIGFFDKKFQLCVKNGLLNINSMKIFPHNKDYFTTNKINLSFIDISYYLNLPEEEYKKTKLNYKELYEKWVLYTQSLVEDDYYVLFQEMSARCLLNVRSGKEALILKGPSDSGKTQYCKILQNVLGSKNYSSVKLHELDPNSQRYSSSSLIGKTCNFAMDEKNAKIKDIELFISIMGGDEFYSRNIYQEANENTKIDQLWISTINEFPEGDYKFETKFLNRIIVIMIKKVIDKKIVDYYKQWESKECKEVIFYWLCEALQRYQKKGYSKIQTKEEKLNLIDQETMDSFISECFEIIPLDNTIKDEYILNTVTSSEIIEIHEKRSKYYGLNQLSDKKLNEKVYKFLKDNYDYVTRKRKQKKDEKTGKRISWYVFENISIIKDTWS